MKSSKYYFHETHTLLRVRLRDSKRILLRLYWPLFYFKTVIVGTF